ncbi:alpha-amylase family glycosyl hydrolase [Mucilaginibacter sp. E4BP6]|uniref:alpha-amylase family glycosyl hydrolase n=1 Tax=Mucilaginibacter sp. E4BP6 TaxID=2723089 RepID=UPI0015CD840D|nr:alpha-amylase family glycosyl hydrolase [Mucilaginibacter sp. E4BP6]NYE67153.1 glycosidase [Mucilaginibacter sp. E4BP6]
MNIQKLKLKPYSPILLLVTILAFSGCSKSKPFVPTPTPTPVSSGDPAQYGTPYASVPATKDIVMYEVNIKTFPNANFAGVESRLDSIKALGVNVIWLMPIYPIGVLKASGSPYSVQDYEGVNSAFGTLSDLRALVTQAHSLGMAVILDWEANGTSWDNAWITSNPSWYIQNGGVIQQLSTYSDVAALNFSNQSMRLALIKAMKYWVFTANVDGYRCDFADNPPADFWTQALDTLNNITTHKLIYLAEGTASTEISSGFQLDYAFDYYGSIKSLFAGSSTPSSLFATNATEISSIPASGTKLRYITNHDDASSDGSTITEYGGKQGALAAFAIVSYMGGVPLIYSSQEVGYPSAINFFNNVPVDYTANPDMVAAYKQILAFRAAHEAIKTGALTQYNDANIVAFEKTSGTDDVLILANTKNATETFNVPAPLQGTTWVNGYTGGNVTFSTQYTLQPYSYLAFKR